MIVYGLVMVASIEMLRTKAVEKYQKFLVKYYKLHIAYLASNSYKGFHFILIAVLFLLLDPGGKHSISFFVALIRDFYFFSKTY